MAENERTLQNIPIPLFLLLVTRVEVEKFRLNPPRAGLVRWVVVRVQVRVIERAVHRHALAGRKCQRALQKVERARRGFGADVSEGAAPEHGEGAEVVSVHVS